MMLRSLVLLAFAVGAVGPLCADDNPSAATYDNSVRRMAEPDETFATVVLQPTTVASAGVLATSSKTCSQRCSTTCSTSCTTTRGCSSNCKVQTDGCGGGNSGSGSSGTQRPAPAPSAAPEPTEVVDINGASAAELEALPGIGPATAAKIISGRPWKRKDDLVKKHVLSQTQYDKLKAWIIAHQ